MNHKTITFFILTFVLLLTACEAHVERLAAMRQPPSVNVDNLPEQTATPENPFIPIKEAVAIRQGGTTEVEFSLYVHRGSSLGFASLGNPLTRNMLVCRGMGSDPFFTFHTQPIDLNGMIDEVVTFNGRMTDVQGASVGAYTCTMELFDDLDNKAYDTLFRLHVVE